MITPIDEILRLRSFAIVWHAAVSKTTLTEKLLLFGLAIRLVRSRRAATGVLGLDGGRARARDFGLLGGDWLGA
jgi:hypothetical protein